MKVSLSLVVKALVLGRPISICPGIDYREPFRRYSRRLVDEVGHKEMKCLLNIGKFQSIDFAGQIAWGPLYIGQYSILSYVASFESY